MPTNPNTLDRHSPPLTLHRGGLIRPDAKQAGDHLHISRMRDVPPVTDTMDLDDALAVGKRAESMAAMAWWVPIVVPLVGVCLGGLAVAYWSEITGLVMGWWQ